MAGTGKRGANDGPATSALFNEPNGLTFVGETLFITDTNNNAIRILDLKTNIVSTLKLTGAMVVGKK